MLHAARCGIDPGSVLPLSKRGRKSTETQVGHPTTKKSISYLKGRARQGPKPRAIFRQGTPSQRSCCYRTPCLRQGVSKKARAGQLVDRHSRKSHVPTRVGYRVEPRCGHFTPSKATTLPSSLRSFSCHGKVTGPFHQLPRGNCKSKQIPSYDWHTAKCRHAGLQRPTALTS